MNMHIVSTNFATTLISKHEYDVKLWRHKQRTPNTISHHTPLSETPPWKFSAYATDLGLVIQGFDASDLFRKLESDQCRQVLPSLAVGAWTSCFAQFWWWTGSTALSGLKVHVLNKMLWPFATTARTTRSKPFFGLAKVLENALTFHQKCTRNEVQALSGSNSFPMTEKASYILLPVSQWKPRAEHEPFAPNWPTSSMLTLEWSAPVLASAKVAGVAC